MRNPATWRLTGSIFVLGTLVLPLALSGAEVHPVESEIKRTFNSVSIESNVTFEAGDTFVGGRLVGGLRARSANNGKDIRAANARSAVVAAAPEMSLSVLYPRSYDGMIVAEAGAQRVVLRAIGTAGSSATESNGKLIYTRPFASTDIVEVPRGNRSEELLLLHDPSAPLTYDYEIVATEGVAAVAIDNGAIRFLPMVVSTEPPAQPGGARFTRPTPWLQIDRPWLIDARGKRSESHAQWSLVGDGPMPTKIRLTITPERLAYPLLVDPTFSAGGSLGTGRSDHTATLLLNGKVLIVGGYNSGGLTSAELYDPTTGTFSATGSLTTGREFHTATMLPNGKVLIAGGVGTSGILSSCELYDPVTGTFTVTASLSAARVHHSATLLPNGKVLIAGGSADYPGASPLASAELFDPAGGTNGSFASTGSLVVARRRHTATLLPNGKVLIAGGMGSTASTTIAVTELYDPSAGTNGAFAESANLGTARYYHTATLLATGQVLIAGGTSDGTNGLTSGEIYDPSTNTVGGTKGSLATARWIHSATLLPNGTVLLVAGTSNGVNYLASAEVFDPGTSLFTTSAASLTTGRIAHTATLLPSGKVLVAAGYNGTRVASAEGYDAGGGTFTATASIASAPYGHTATMLPNGKVLIAGGYSYSGAGQLTAGQLFDPGSGSFNTTGSLASARAGATATLLLNGRVLIAAGSYNSVWLQSCELYDPSTETFAPTGSLAHRRGSHTATLLANGKVLIVGGYDAAAVPMTLATAELYDPLTGTFSPTGGLTTGRYYHTATLLPNGKVLVVGGFDGVTSTWLASAEVYDPAVGTFSPTGSLTNARGSHTSTLLPSGKILIAGGRGLSGEVTSAELYDPTLGSFSATGSLATGRQSPSATVLPTGSVLLAGGYNSVSGALASAELYDPATGTFSATGNLVSTRNGYTATLLPNGKVLLAGGQTTAACELYDAGVGFSDSRRPVITTAPSVFRLPGTLSLIGTNFRGDSEASSGQTDASPTNYPIVQLTRIDNEQTTVVTPSSNFSDTSWSVSRSSLVTAGWYRLTLFANAIPSVQQIVEIGTTDLTVTKSHSGNFTQGDTGKTYTITVMNSGTAATTGTVTLTDPLPMFLSATAISGSGWTCSISGSPNCTRSDVLPAGSSYPSITLTVDVATNAMSFVNTATVSGGGESNPDNDSASDMTTMTPKPDLSIGISHGSFTQGQTLANYTITATNSGTVATSGTVTVTASVPSGLTATGLSGTNWNCVLATLTCTRSDALAAGSAYPVITLTTNVAANAPTSVTTSATISGGGEIYTSNDTASDQTTIALLPPDLTVTKSHTGNFFQGQTGATYTITVTNISSNPTTGMVSVTDTLPAGLTKVSMSGPLVGPLAAPPPGGRPSAAAQSAPSPSIVITAQPYATPGAWFGIDVTVLDGNGNVMTGYTGTVSFTSSDPAASLPSSYTFIASDSGVHHFSSLILQTIGTQSVTATDTSAPSMTGTTSLSVRTDAWACDLSTLTCTRSDALAGGASYPPITLTVNVANNAPASVTNSVTDSGGGQVNLTNDIANDVTTVIPPADLSIVSSHSGDFIQGQMFRKYALTVTNNGPNATTGVVTVVDTLPAGLSTVAIGGPGWICSTGNLTCSRSDALAFGNSYPAITLTVNVAQNAASTLTNVATVTSAGDLNGANNTSNDATTVNAVVANCGTFSNAATGYPSADQMTSVAVGDFNADGKADLAVTDQTLGIVLIYLGNGDGTFVQGTSVTAATGAVAVAVGDLNGDGKADLAIANTSGSISIRDGNGDGTFFSAGNQSIGSIPVAVVIGDFNSDGRLDLAVADSYSNQVDTLINGTRKTANVGSAPVALAVGDFNGDGKADLAVANSGSNDVSILIGQSSGTFKTAVNYGAGNSPSSIAVGDFNHDGRLDLAVANKNSSNVSILLGAGNGTFGTATSYTVPGYPAAIAAGDIDGDGNIDLVIGSDSQLTILKGDGSGSFGTPVIYSPLYISSVAIADVNGDGKPDLALTYFTNFSGGVLIMTNVCPDLTITKSHSGNFVQNQVGATYSLTAHNSGAGVSVGAVTVTDTLPAGLTATAISGNGWNCVLNTLTCVRSDELANGFSYDPITVTVNVAGNAPSTVTNSVTISGGSEVNTGNNSASDPTTVVPPQDLAIAVTHSGNFTQGQMFRTYTITVSNVGSFQTAGAVTVTDALPPGMTASTIGGSGWFCQIANLTCVRADALAAGASYPPLTLTVNVDINASASLTNTATVSGGGEVNTANDTASDPTTITPVTGECGTFAPATTYATGSAPASVTVADFNGDHVADLAIANPGSNDISILLGNGSGGFTTAPTVSISGSLKAIAAGDVDGDGKTDLVVFSDLPAQLSVFTGNGDGTFAIMTAGSAYASTVVLADVNNNGSLDAVTADTSSNSITTYTLVNPYALGGFSLGASPSTIAVSDFDNDGKLDLVVGYANRTFVTVFLGLGNGSFGTGTNYSTGTGPSSLAVGDFNRDGNLDLVVGNGSTNTVSILFGDGHGVFSGRTDYTALSHPIAVGVSDFNGDGNLDIAVTAGANVAILLNSGTGTFGPPTTFPIGGSSSSAMAIADFNLDGKPDLAVTSSTDNNVSILVSACPDLTITKSHTGNLSAGQTGASYSIVVSNTGTGMSKGTVTVADTLPSALTATAISGTGWACVLNTLTCTRTNLLSPGSSHPAITVTVNVAANAPATLTNTAVVSGGGELNVANDTASDPATVAGTLITPTNLVATATSTTQVSITWDAVTVATKYQVFRSSNNSTFALVATPTSAALTDTALTPGTTYVYQIKAADASNNTSPPTPNEIATTIIFTDDPLVAGATTVKAVHLTELRTAVNAVRAAAGLSAATFTDSSPAGVFIQAVHINELRTALTTARSALGLPTISYTDPSLSAGIAVKAAHLQELRSGVK